MMASENDVDATLVDRLAEALAAGRSLDPDRPRPLVAGVHQLCDPGRLAALRKLVAGRLAALEAVAPSGEALSHGSALADIAGLLIADLEVVADAAWRGVNGRRVNQRGRAEMARVTGAERAKRNGEVLAEYTLRREAYPHQSRTAAAEWVAARHGLSRSQVGRIVQRARAPATGMRRQPREDVPDGG
jgi:hypothetical protein